MGRPSKFTPEIHRRIIDLVKAGNYIEKAAQSVGISRRTLYEWLAKGRDCEIEEDPFAALYTDWQKAIAHCELRCVALIAKAAETDVKAAMWLLEHRFPEDWGRHRVEVTGPEEGPVQVQHGVRREELRAALKEMDEESLGRIRAAVTHARAAIPAPEVKSG